MELETGGAPMQRSRTRCQWSACPTMGVAELRTQRIDPWLDRGWIQHSSAGHTVAAVFEHKQDRLWRIWNDCRGLDIITRPAVEPLPHIDIWELRPSG